MKGLVSILLCLWLMLLAIFLADIHFHVKDIKTENVRLLSRLDYDKVYLNNREYQIIGRYE